MSFRSSFVVFAAAASLALPSFAKIVPGAPFSDRAVLQREMPLPVWGTATRGSTITVSFADQSVSTRADGNGKWSLRLSPLKTSRKNRTMTIVEKAPDGTMLETLEIKDILVGEVWFASGQSNMECPIWGGDTRFRDKKGKMMFALAQRDEIRFAVTPTSWKLTPQENVNVTWKTYTPKSFEVTSGHALSGIAFYYALTLHDALRVPIGLVEASWGGTNIDAWTPRAVYAKYPELSGVSNFPLRENWSDAYVQDAIAGPHQQPTVIWNGMVEAWVPMAMRGVIWYQGCSNLPESYMYATKMHALYDGWRDAFGNPNLKLYFAELAPYSINWWDLQLQQLKFAAEEPNAAMVPTCDVGNLHDIHPNNKEPVARRMALLALKYEYGYDIVADAPRLKAYEIVGDRFEMTFDFASSWYFHSDDWSHPAGFEIAGEDGIFHPAKIVNKLVRVGIYEGEKLLVSSDKVKEPKALRYLAVKPWRGWLYSADSALPLGPFEISTLSRESRQRGPVAHLGDALVIPELEGYRRLYVADLPSNGRFNDKGYTFDDSSSAVEFSRLAYVLELERGDGSVDWVMTSMDAFTNDVKTVGVPARNKGAVHNTRVTNLTVRSNLKCITEVTDYDGGSVEIWNCNAYTWTGNVVPGGSAEVFDFSDLPVEVTKDGCGSMQVHDWKRGVTIWGYNDFNSWNKTQAIGMGREEFGGHPDFSYAMNTGRYRSRRLTVLVK